MRQVSGFLFGSLTQSINRRVKAALKLPVSLMRKLPRWFNCEASGTAKR
jgi:hypothetical protein